MAELGVTTVVRRAKGNLSADLDGDAVVLGLDTGLYYGLNEVAARVWSLLEDPRPVDEVVRTIVEEYDVDADVCRRDVIALLGRLRDEGLVEVPAAG